jgi:hypothetical protein
MSLAQTARAALARRLPGGARLSGAAGGGLPCQPRSARRSAAAPASGAGLVQVGPHAIEACARWRSPTVRRSKVALRHQSPGVQTFQCARKTRWVVGRRMVRTGFPPAPGSRHRGSVGDHPRSGGRAVGLPAPSDSPSLATHEGARRPALYGDTSARLAVAPYAPFLASVPHLGDKPISIWSNRHPAFYTASQPPSGRLRNGWP